MNIELKEYSQFFGDGFTVDNLSIGELRKIKKGFVMFSAENVFWAETPSWNFYHRKNLTRYELDEKTNRWNAVEFYGEVSWDGKGWIGFKRGYIAKLSK